MARAPRAHTSRCRLYSTSSLAPCGLGVHSETGRARCVSESAFRQAAQASRVKSAPSGVTSRRDVRSQLAFKAKCPYNTCAQQSRRENPFLLNGDAHHSFEGEPRIRPVALVFKQSARNISHEIH